MRVFKILLLVISLSFTISSCSKDGGLVSGSPQPAMAPHYFLPAYTTDASAPNARILTNTSGVNQAITLGMPDAIYYTSGYPAAGITFTLKDQTGAVLTTLTGVQQGTTFVNGLYYVVTLPSIYLMQSSWNGKIVTISVSNSSAITKYKVVP